MNVIVLLRAVRDPAGFTVNRKAQKLFVNRERFITNPSDRNALEAALALAGAGDLVTAVAVGGQPAQQVLQQARATGASRAVWVPLESAAAVDGLCLTTVMQRVVAHLNPVDLVLLGADVLDGDLAQVGPRLAAVLDWPFVEAVLDVTAPPEGGLDFVVGSPDRYRRLGSDGPVVASVAADCNQPRFAPAASIITTYRDESAVERLTLADVGLDEAELKPATSITSESFPPERTLGRMAEGIEAVAAALRANARPKI